MCTGPIFGLPCREWKGGGGPHSWPRLNSCSSAFSHCCWKSPLGTIVTSLSLFLSGCGSSAQLLCRWLFVADYRHRTCHWRRLLFRKSETIALAGVCLTEVPRRLRARDIYWVKWIRLACVVKS